MSDVVHVIRATIDPSTAPTREGQHWINTTTNKTWLSVGTISVANWVLVNDSNQVKASNTDTTAAFLDSKLAAGTGISLTVLNPGANEVISISAPGSTTDEKVKVSVTDTTAGYLNTELTVSNGTNTTNPLEKSITSPSGDEKLNIQFDQSKLALTSSQVSDLTETVQDIMGAALVDSSSIDFQYSDVGNTQTAVVIPGGVNHNLLLNGSGNTHIDHSTVNINAGTGLSGGGDITTSRTLNLANTTVIASSYGSATQVPNYTVDAQGRLTAAANTSIQIVESQVTGLTTDLLAKADKVTTISTGTGLTGGGDLSTNRTLSISSTGVTASSYGSATQVPSFTVNAQGQLTTSANINIAIASTQIADFTEAAQDAVGGALVDSTSIDFTYNDAANQITAVVLPAGVNHNLLLNGGGNTHIDHSTVSINAGTGLTGGGDITTSRTISMPNTGTAGTYGDATHYPVITTDAQGRITSVTTQLSDSNWVDSGGLLTWSDETGKDLNIRQAGSSGSAYIRQVSSNGTLASPTATTSGQRLGGNGMYGWNSGGADGLPSGAMNVYATENHTATANGGEMRIELIPDGSTTPVTTATFENNGDLVIAGGVRVGNTSDAVDGYLRLNSSEMQVRQGGVWYVIAPNVTYLNATAAVTTTSATFATVGSMTTTPAAGAYKLDFTCAAALSASTSTGDFGVFIAGVEQAQCRRTIGNGAASAVASSIAISTIVTVNGSQALTVQFRENASATLTVNTREFVLTPISR